MAIRLTFTIEIEVTDEAAFREHAKRIMDEGGNSDWEPGDLSDCAIAIFDPGMSPPGCEIQDSSAQHDE